jgi:Lrp/AsnC family transcriptional regulator, leucine-responsive regulatory protein
MNIDHLDRLILEALQTDADITHDALGMRLHTSAATCQRRIKRLKSIGAIEKTVAVVSPQAVGQPLIAVVEVTMTAQTDEVLSAFEALSAQSVSVQQCYRVTTGPDFILVLAMPDMQAYHALASALFSAVNEVRNVRTFFSVLRSKFSTEIPVGPTVTVKPPTLTMRPE